MLCRVRRRLYLMRHAEVSYVGQRDERVVLLTERGRQQAAAARDALAGVDLDLVVTSGLPRTLETAEIVVPGREPERWPALEQLFVGALHVRDEAQRFLGGESLGEALDRVLSALDELLAREWQTALAILHGGVNRIVLSHALAGGRTYLAGFEQAPACLNVLDVDENGWIVRTVNYVPYDPLHPARTTTMEHLWADLAAWLDERDST
jgi:probable phosphoglycerate mutase